ncbi:MAG TPA: GH1 family beta-glucosidase [Candidatus Eisenbacteria bacterium]
MSDSTRFPDGFVWGAATSAYQVEGSPLADGAGPSNWHRFAHTPGRTLNGDTGDVACDHYRRYPADVDLMSALGLGGYRFSLSWSRILPEGRGRVNPKGLDFYSRLVDLLLTRGIWPLVTLFHWDLPAALEDEGGWLDARIADWFGDYAEVAFGALGDRVPMWATLNEPWVVMDAGYLHGVHAPGRRSAAEAATAARHLLLAHGAAVERFRARGPGRIGLVVNLEPKHPASGSAADVEATARADDYMNHQFLDPVLLGRSPARLADVFGGTWSPPSGDELRRIGQALDFIGVNYYTRSVVRDDPAAPPVRASAVRQSGSVYTATGWEVHPASLTEVLCGLKERYGDVPLYVTENGAAFDEPPAVTGDRLDDPLRVHYLREHLLAAREAIRRGVDLRGYFAWSLLDNFEWASGYSKRFGLVHVDFDTQRRTLKSSALYYRDVIRSNGSILSEALPALPG